MLGECNFLGSVLSQQKFEATDVKALGASQLSDSVTAQFYLENENISLRHEGMLTQKTQREERESVCWRETLGPLAPLFICLFLHRACPMYIGLARNAVCSTSGPHSSPWSFLSSIFAGFSLPCLLATAILDSFFLFKLLVVIVLPSYR